MAAATIEVARAAEAAGFTHLWLFDSSLQWREPYPLLTLAATATTRLRLGTCVTNPATRHPTVTAALLATLGELSDRSRGPRHRPGRQCRPDARRGAAHDP